MKHQELTPPTQTNAVGIIGAVISVIGLVVIIGALIWVKSVDSDLVEVTAEGTYNPMRVAGKVTNAMTGLAKFVLFVVGGLVGGTLSVVGTIVSAIGLAYDRRTSAWFGLCSGLIAIVLLAGFVLINT